MVDLRRETGIEDALGNMIRNGDILFNTGWNDLWWVRFSKGEWVCVLINDGETTELVDVCGFEICGYITDMVMLED